ncbi:phage tail assembly protein [Paracoccus sp. 22332]|uniref:phage tail assembly protein n=1 Tax=Paracoccus sp. 22332 TaxID=3453913 RepID=UPI003F85B489
MTDIVEFRLDWPVEFKGEKIEALTFRRRKAKDLVAMDAVKGDMAKTMAMYASMCGKPLPVIEDMDADDFERMVEATLPLMGKTAAAMVERQAKGPVSH